MGTGVVYSLQRGSAQFVNARQRDKSRPRLLLCLLLLYSIRYAGVLYSMLLFLLLLLLLYLHLLLLLQ